MAVTNFAAQTDHEKKLWSMSFWKQARNQSFTTKFLGSDANSMIQRVTELKKSEKGARAVITLLADLVDDGVAGDRELVGREESMKSDEIVIQVDQLRHAVRNKGRMNDQRSIVNFREYARDKLSYMFADRIDQMAFLTLAGLDYSLRPNGTTRPADSALRQLEFNKDITAPTGQRGARWDAASGLVFGTGAANTNLVDGDVPTWNTIMELKKHAKNTYMRGVQSGGEETFHCFLNPDAMLLLKQDPDYLANLRHAQTRGGDNALFTGGSVKIDGVMLHEFRHVPGGFDTGTVGTKGSYMLFVGAQALAYADLGNAYWDEEEFDFGNSAGISIGKILGFRKPKFDNIYTGTEEDFGVIRCAVAHKKA